MRKGTVPKCVKPWTRHSWIIIVTAPVGQNFPVCQLEFCPHCGIFAWRGVHDGSRDYESRLLRRHAISAQFWQEDP
jgi:hypothetical protein